MGLRFRKSFKVMPGVRATIGLKGGSVSIGGRAARVRMSTRGVYGTVGIPGTGLSYETRLSGGASRSRSANPQYQRISKRELQRAAKEERFRSVLTNFRLLLDEETGAVEMLDAHGSPLSNTEKAHVWQNKASLLNEWLEQKCQTLNEDADDIARVHEDMPSPDDVLEYEFESFEEPEPVSPKAPIEPAKPEPSSLPVMSFWGKLFKSVRLAHEQVCAEQEARYQQRVKDWQENLDTARAKYSQAMKAFEQEHPAWQQRKADFMQEQLRLSQEFQQKMRHDTDFMAELLDQALDELDWPRETQISYEIADQGKTVWLDVDLPEIEDLPQKVASIAPNGKRLSIKTKSQTQLRLDYARHIHGVLLRLAAVVLATLPSCQEVIVSGYSQRPDKSTGQVNDEYLLSARMTRAKFARINFDRLDQLDPIPALDAFETRKSMTKTHVFKAIEPFAPEA